MTIGDYFKSPDEPRLTWPEPPKYIYFLIPELKKRKNDYLAPTIFSGETSKTKAQDVWIAGFFGLLFTIFPLIQFKFPDSLLAGLIFWAMGLPLLRYAFRRLRELRSAETVNEPIFLLDKPQFIRGVAAQGVFDCLYHSRRPLPKEGKVFARLVVVEATQTEVGTDKTSEVAELHNEELPVQTLPAQSKSYRAVLSVPLPSHLPPSRLTESRQGKQTVRQKVVWQVQVSAYSGRQLVSQSAFVIDVI